MPETLPTRPPWLSESAVEACSGCGACVEACPARLLSLVDDKPKIDFHAECTFCGACAEACADGLFDRARTPFEHVAAVSDRCLAFQGIDCQICRDACPQSAIRFNPRRGGPFLPEVRSEACVGCGACIPPCPAGAIRMEPLGEAAYA